MQSLARVKPSQRRFQTGNSTLPLNLGTADLMLLVSRDPTARLVPNLNLITNSLQQPIGGDSYSTTTNKPACPLVPTPSKPVGGRFSPAEASCSSPASRLASIADSLSSKSLACDASRSFKSPMASWSLISDQPTSSSNFSLTYSMTVMFRRRSSNNSPELCA